MQVKQVTLTNYRNYNHAQVQLSNGKNILIGDNAQGKSNFLEAIEVASRGKSQRTSEDSDLISWQKPHMHLAVDIERSGYDESISYALKRTNESKRLEKKIAINEVSQSNKQLLGKLVTVTFSTQDLSMLRDGPKFRRDWIDTIAFSLQPAFQDIHASYQKVITQRNRLLKQMFEKGRVSVSDQDQLLAWDKQMARYGAQIIKTRIKLLQELLPLAENYQSHLSGQTELLSATYIFKPSSSVSRAFDSDDQPIDHLPEAELPIKSFEDGSELEVARSLLSLLRKIRGEEIARRQTLLGPHRDDIAFTLNGASALAFASQGQQRSLVLSMKLAELELITDKLGESPVLLLDDVLAELDVDRQGLLMSALNKPRQTVITTTHLSRFEPEWLQGAHVFSVTSGHVTTGPEPVSLA